MGADTTLRRLRVLAGLSDRDAQPVTMAGSGRVIGLSPGSGPPVWYDPHDDTLTDEATARRAAEVLDRAAAEDAAGWVALGISGWKRGWLTDFLGGDVVFRDRPEAARALAERTGRRLAVWASRDPGGEATENAVRIEDGMLRSRGLGARLVPPGALVLDDLGIAYDPRRESRLERLIGESAALPHEEIERAEHLIASIRALGLSKYNIGGDPGPDVPEGAILVAGQVEDDASVLAGAGRIATNRVLLEAARAAHPEAPLVYKPHPDVEAGLRRGAVPDATLAALGATALRHTDPVRLFPRVARVWTKTSGLGFEALLHGVPVTCTGAPFYAGWGLTDDRGDIPARRTARPALAALAHAVLIGYPRYRDPMSGLPCPPEVWVRRLASGADLPPASGWRARLQAMRGHLARRARPTP